MTTNDGSMSDAVGMIQMPPEAVENQAALPNSPHITVRLIDGFNAVHPNAAWRWQPDPWRLQVYKPATYTEAFGGGLTLLDGWVVLAEYPLDRVLSVQRKVRI